MERQLQRLPHILHQLPELNIACKAQRIQTKKKHTAVKNKQMAVSIEELLKIKYKKNPVLGKHNICNESTFKQIM